MATFQDDIQSHSTSEVANNGATTGITGWTWASAGSGTYQNATIVDIGGGVKVLRVYDSGWGNQMVMQVSSIGSLGAGVAAEALIKWRINSLIAAHTDYVRYQFPSLRMSSGAPTPGYGVGFLNATGPAYTQQLWYFNASTDWANVGASKTITSTWATAEWWWTRLQVSAAGDWLWRSWKDGGAEPGAWQNASASDTSRTSGYVGFCFFDIIGSEIDIGYFSAGTAGDVAPSPGGGGGATIYGRNVFRSSVFASKAIR